MEGCSAVHKSWSEMCVEDLCTLSTQAKAELDFVEGFGTVGVKKKKKKKKRGTQCWTPESKFSS